MRYPANAPPAGKPFAMRSPHNQVNLQVMDERSRKITDHENRHAAVLRASGVDPSAASKFTEQQGSDGRKYKVAGEVEADLTPIKGNPRATEKKAESVYRSAIGDDDRSDEDYTAARNAQMLAQESRQKKLAAKMKGLGPDGLPTESEYQPAPRF